MAVVLAIVLCALAVPLLLAPPANLTSDESLYLAEAYNIAHGKGFTYPSGEPVTHRAPLFPAVLAPVVRLNGPDAAYAVTRVVVLANVALLLALGWRMSGILGGAIASGLALASSYLNWMGTTLYLDPFQTTFLLLALLLLLRATNSQQPVWFALAGVAAGTGFLAKESSMQWIPLGVLAWLMTERLHSRQGALGALLYTMSLLLVIAPWLVWVWLQTGQIYLLGEVTPQLVALAGSAFTALLLLPASIRLWPRIEAEWRATIRRLRWPAALALLFGWCGFILYGLTAYSSWGYPNDYLSTLPRYLFTVAAQVQPLFLLFTAWCWIVYRAMKGDGASRLLLLAAALFLPFAIFAANRMLQLRDALPLVYLSYLALGVAAADVLGSVTKSSSSAWLRAPLFVAGIALTGVFVAHEWFAFQSKTANAQSGPAAYESWDNPFVERSADWLRGHLPEGSRLLTSRLYFSSLYVETDGRFEIRQLPTVRVEIDPESPGLLVPRSNLFRWGDLDVRPAESPESWLYLKQYPRKDYWVGLSQLELLEYIQRHRIDYVVLTGDDVAFSSVRYADYFVSAPGFELLHEDAGLNGQHLFVFSVNRGQLQPAPHSTIITPSSVAALLEQTGMSRPEVEEALGSRLRVTDQEVGLLEREQTAVLSGVDLLD